MVIPGLIWKLSHLKKKSVQSLFERLAEACVKRWLTEKGLETLDIPWLSVDGFKAQGNCRARVEALCKTQSSTMGRSKRHALHNSIRQKNGKRTAPAHLKSSVVAPFLVPDLRVGDAAAQLD